MSNFSIWIEAEHWPTSEWNHVDGNTDVIVTLNTNSRWMATFVSYKNVETLVRWRGESGEDLSGKFLWIANMVLIDDISRSSIEKVVQHLVDEEELTSVFGDASRGETEG